MRNWEHEESLVFGRPVLLKTVRTFPAGYIALGLLSSRTSLVSCVLSGPREGLSIWWELRGNSEGTSISWDPGPTAQWGGTLLESIMVGACGKILQDTTGNWGRFWSQSHSLCINLLSLKLKGPTRICRSLLPTVSSVMYPASIRIPSPKYPSSLYITTLGTEILANGLSGNKPHPTPSERRCGPVSRWLKSTPSFPQTQRWESQRVGPVENRGDGCVSRRRGQKQGNSKGTNAEALG